MARYQGNVHHKLRTFADNWAEPYTTDELAVDPRKVNDIRNWISDSINKGRILLLTGPTGCGKTATVRFLARCSDIEIREWITPLDRDYSNDSEPGYYQSALERFEDFLYSCSRYSNLFASSAMKRSILLIEDYPNIFLQKPELFHEVLVRYKATARAPIVFITSDCADKNINVLTELFPTQIQFKLGISHIMLNPITHARMVKAVNRMGSLLNKLHPGYRPPTLETVNEVSESANGDIRCAMLTLRMKPQEDAAALFELAMKPKRRVTTDSTKGLTREESIVAACGKDDRVGILHGVGRVLNPKWCDGTKSLASQGKRKRKGEEKQDRLLNVTTPGAELVHNPNSVVDSFLSSASTFLLFVQENYLNHFSSIESAADAALCLSNAEVLMAGVGLDGSREMSFNLGVRGVMLHNKVPHRAFNPVRGPRHLGFANTQTEIMRLSETMFPCYPVSLTVLMMDLIPFMSCMPNAKFSTDQLRFIQGVASMEPITKFCESFKSIRKLPKDQNAESSKASFLIHAEQKPAQSEDDAELHISDDDSEEESIESLKPQRAVPSEEVQQEFNYSAMLHDDDDDDILLSQL